VELPRRYPFNPPWRIILLLFATGAGMLALLGLHWAPARLGAALGAIVVAFAFVLAVRRIALPRFLELGQDAFLLPAGFLRARTTKIVYADIEWTREIKRGDAILELRAKGRTYDILSSFLPDAASYVDVGNFVTSRLREEQQKHPRPPQSTEGSQYCFQCSYEGNGEIYNRAGEILWRCRTQHPRGDPQSTFVTVPMYGLLRLADFVVYDTAEKELLRVKRDRRLPMARFVMVENGSPVCTIRQRSILLNRYQLDFAGGPKWTFHMPLFTVYFKGVSDAGARIRVRLWSHNVWYALIDTGVDSPRLVAALAFIHRERLRCG
jgi:hypothetical protein